METTAIKRGVTVAEYASFERDAPEKHILWDGEVFATSAMAAATPEHNAIEANVVTSLANALRGRPCRVFTSNQSVWVPRKGGIVYPDTTVVCGPLARHPSADIVVVNPSLVVEVLSPGTEAFDRAEKFAGYRSIETLRHYVMVSSLEVQVEQYTRLDDGTWKLRVLGSGDAMTFAAPDLSLAVDDLYAGVFGSAASL